METNGTTDYSKLWTTVPKDRWNPNIASSVVPKRQLWGIPEVIGTFVLFLFLQVVVVLVMGAYEVLNNFEAFRQSEDQSTFVLEAVTNLSTSNWLILLSAVTMHGAWIFGMWLSSRTRGLGSFIEDFKFRFKWSDLHIGLGLALGFRLIEQLVFFLLGKTSLDMTGAGNADVVMNMDGWWWVINAIVVAGILAPVAEELFFRGFAMYGIQNTLKRISTVSKGRRAEMKPLAAAMNPHAVAYMESGVENALTKAEGAIEKSAVGISVIVSSILFGLMHFQGVETFGQIFVVIWTGTLGAAMAIMTVKTGRLGLAVCFHIAYNMSGVLLARLLGS